MQAVQCHTRIPIPKILDWSDDPTNPIGAAYIIMEHVEGVLLQEVWGDMPTDQKIKCIGAICTTILPISELDFPAYGSLYFADAAFVGADSKQILDNDSRYCIGPHCRGSTYWNCNVGEPRYYAFKEPNRGPCKMAFPSQLRLQVLSLTLHYRARPLLIRLCIDRLRHCSTATSLSFQTHSQSAPTGILPRLRIQTFRATQSGPSRPLRANTTTRYTIQLHTNPLPPRSPQKEYLRL